MKNKEVFAREIANAEGDFEGKFFKSTLWKFAFLQFLTLRQNRMVRAKELKFSEMVCNVTKVTRALKLLWLPRRMFVNFTSWYFITL